jgi:hypothetical protein
MPKYVMISEQALRYFGKTKADYVTWCHDHGRRANDTDSKRDYFESVSKEEQNKNAAAEDRH